ncbi:hypothetical protein AM493_05380 [Flavobacterium akiainvivens]|uniref:Acyltransferase 3 domain-containing protein n=1 Tax=Flavobacterium akiainvivens TaxID=1202724 RepID=A0A0M9VHG7_9FLAO|nr:acyltransferase [Flavobacterium akiainvivens]KOS05526.1 hypothetical protein AM493_05380 [Flavobacterium akiainvivens]SFQ33647.1 Peptidoglycan/LPS O-acetylase OafA/YrhL, contains acyltransferase and SGNH-hydrolase domains [Flavobacterium akiainvivens]
MSSQKRLYEIDIFRFIAALSVLLFHYTFRGAALQDYSGPSFPEMGNIFRYGYLGVDFFFLISGFVIVLSIKKPSLAAFLKSRVVRLYPAYWFCLTVTFIVLALWGKSILAVTFPQYLVNLTMFQRFVGVDHIDWVYWTLMVEIKFYILIAIFIVANYRKKIDLNYLIYGWLALSCLPHIIDFTTLLPLKAIYFIFALDYSPYFIAGMLFFKIFTEGQKAYYLAGVLLCLLLSALNAATYAGELSAYYKTHFSATVTTSVIAVCYIILYLISTKKLEFLNKPVMLKIGVLTYPLYLIHQNIGYVIFNNFGGQVNKYVLLSITTVFMIAFSYGIHIAIEKPFARWLKQKFDKAG